MNTTNKLTGELNHPGDKDADDKFDEVYGTEQKPTQPNGTFTFQCVLRFEIDPETAANLLVESDPTKTVHNWLLTQKPSSEDNAFSGNAGDLRTSLSRYLGDKAIEKARLLLPSTDAAQLTY